MHLKWSHGSHHAEVIHHEKTVTRHPVQSSAGEPTGSQKISMNVKVWQAAGERIKLVLHLEGAQVSKGYLVLMEGDRES